MATAIEPRPLRDRGGIAPGVSMDQWLPTPLAARALGVSTRTLKRYGHPEVGFLVPGVHWVAGPFANSTLRWDVETCRQVLHHRGMRVIGDVRPGDRLPVVLSAGI
ncbi:MAG: hypothetical protein N3Z28_04080 [Synechococcaceae cyanobacterium MAG-AL2]|uniref:hypothetical protein n=2 Tax=Synechococcaceae TaxID=1890426 RepID=UPI00281D396A|nr:hypothetical protein [Candidatus Regnicoccus frigidus]MCT0201692.1 hypothetical protein [Synechococcus sp. CS-603]MCT4365964.1 hypothetical protein [Candidatus Regnicoccus frigidus MAG-AL1]MCT4366832.1 hypothetical protein [Candidatus Regnicoccus frigidus MAG-AL2]